MKKNIFSCSLILVLIFQSSAQQLYKISLLRAAPGKLLGLIDEAKVVKDENGPFIMRHSQGDHWDLMLIEIVDRVDAGLNSKIKGQNWEGLLSFSEQMLVSGPQKEEFKRRYADNDFFHIEIFMALPGKGKELLQEREMENEYLRELGRPQNHIFSKIFGARWDYFTIGYYRDIKHYAQSADIPEDKEEQAAIKAGFESAAKIGSYLRTLISEHHDTLTVKVR